MKSNHITFTKHPHIFSAKIEETEILFTHKFSFEPQKLFKSLPKGLGIKRLSTGDEYSFSISHFCSSQDYFFGPFTNNRNAREIFKSFVEIVYGAKKKDELIIKDSKLVELIIYILTTKNWLNIWGVFKSLFCAPVLYSYQIFKTACSS